jgi:release factor glutamine methyltransferase
MGTKAIRIKNCDGVYAPEEDSYLIEEAVRKYAYGKTLDIGTGTGILGIAAAQEGCDVTFSDINDKALECARINAKENGVRGRFIESDLFKNIQGKFNTVIFNPPYLPPDGRRQTPMDTATYGGMNGREIIDRFLREYLLHVEDDHVILLLESSLNGYTKDTDAMNAEIVCRGSQFFEELVVLKFK